jgi:hypothetical protein
MGVTIGLVGLAAAPAAPVRADLMGNAFLRALTDAGVPYSQPATTTALGQSVCPMLVGPDGSFDSVLSKIADANGLPHDTAGVFTLIAIATYCPAVMAPLLSDRVPA